MTFKNLYLFVISLTLLISAAHARSWERITIPDAYCGSGAPYSVFVDRGEQEKLFVEFMGGGACWDTWSCYGPRPHTWIHPIPAISTLSLLSSSNEKRSPFAEHSAIYFPYCTGDVYAGSHTATYQLGAKVRHHGRKNIKKAIAYLNQRSEIDFEQINELNIFGASAGAIGAVIHSHRLAAITPQAESKSLIVDSPGLHFGREFWDKFSDQLNDDIELSLSEVDFFYDRSDGFVAPGIVQTCQFYEDFSIGILQGSRDLIMSYKFGEVSPRRHEELIYSDQGLYELTQKVSNCAAWVPETYMHTFLLLSTSSKMQADKDNKTAFDFAMDVTQGQTQKNYR